jgi:hypothetical protein
MTLADMAEMIASPEVVCRLVSSRGWALHQLPASPCTSGVPENLILEDSWSRLGQSAGLRPLAP